MESFVRNCVVVPRKGDNPFPEIDGLRIAALEGYAVIPLGEYEALVQAAVKDAAFLAARSSVAGRTRYAFQP
jgi:hypothetical protein